MTEYIWEFGVDWNAVETDEVSYLRGGLASGNVALPGTTPVKINDTVTFRIFDITSSLPPDPRVASIDTFDIDSKAAVKGQSADNALSNLHFTSTMITRDTAPPPAGSGSKCFLTETVHASWTLAPVVTVLDHVGRFLLTAHVQAKGTDDKVRSFRLDPEMVVGANE